jgi:hypothetical protein
MSNPFDELELDLLAKPAAPSTFTQTPAVQEPSQLLQHRSIPHLPETLPTQQVPDSWH